MYERQIDANTVLTMEADYDVKDINQTFTQISDNINPELQTLHRSASRRAAVRHAAAQLRWIFCESDGAGREHLQ
jgi:uncharacterized protein YukE